MRCFSMTSSAGNHFLHVQQFLLLPGTIYTAALEKLATDAACDTVFEALEAPIIPAKTIVLIATMGQRMGAGLTCAFRIPALLFGEGI